MLLKPRWKGYPSIKARKNWIPSGRVVFWLQYSHEPLMLQKSGTSQDDMVWSTLPFIIGIGHKTPFPIISWFQIHHHQLQSYPILYLYLPVGPNVSCFIQTFQMNHHQYLLGNCTKLQGLPGSKSSFYGILVLFVSFLKAETSRYVQLAAWLVKFQKYPTKLQEKDEKDVKPSFLMFYYPMKMSCSKFKLNRPSR